MLSVLRNKRFAIIHEEYEWEIEHQHLVTDETLLSSPLRSFLTSLVNLPSMIFHLYLHAWMHPFLITHMTHHMLVHNSTMERISY